MVLRRDVSESVASSRAISQIAVVAIHHSMSRSGLRTGPEGQSGSAQSRGAGFATELDEKCRAGRRQREAGSDREPEPCVRAIDLDDSAQCVGRPYECEEDEQA